jgi:undecaprenyl-diphosphatase
LSLVHILLLAIVQGLAEFLPISSSGHLVVVDSVLTALGRPAPKQLLEVSIVLHLGTLVSIVVVYWRRIWRLLGSDWRVIPRLVVGTLPAVAIGLPLKMLAPEVLENPLVAGLMFPVTGILLIWAARQEPGDLDYPELSYRRVLVIGLFQAAAILPGLSRSGTTIVAGLLVGMGRTSAATFAFLLAIPAILGAGVLEGADMVQAGGSTAEPSVLLAGFLVSAVVGVIALAWLIRLLERGRLDWFAYWLIPLGLAVTVWQLWP